MTVTFRHRVYTLHDEADLERFLRYVNGRRFFSRRQAA